MSEKKRGRPTGSQNPTARFNRGLAHYARQELPPELYVEWKFAIAQGHDAVLVRDERCTHTNGWKIEHREGGPIPSLDYRNRAIDDLRHAAYGLPAQQIQVDTQIRQQAMIAVAGVDLRTSQSLDVGARAELLASIERLLGSGSGQTEPDVEDAEFQDVNVKEQDELADGVEDRASEPLGGDVEAEHGPDSADDVG